MSSPAPVVLGAAVRDDAAIKAALHYGMDAGNVPMERM